MLNRKRLAVFGVGIAALSMVLVGVLTLHFGTTHAAVGGSTTLQNLSFTGTGGFVSGSASGAGDSVHEVLAPNRDIDQQRVRSSTPSVPLPTTNPDPTGNNVVASNGGSGFKGLDHVDTRTRDGGNAFSLEPPDQGLCVGHGFVVEAINDVMTVFNASGTRVAPTTSMNTFFGLPVPINRTTGARGPFLSDPKCLYDAGTDRFFLTVLVEPAGPDAAHLTIRPATLIAVSKTNNPTLANGWNLYSIDASDDGQNGTPSHPGCPCLGDQPLIGANADGFFISTNEFPWFVNGFNGAQVYAMSKSGLVNGTLPKVVHIDTGAIPTPDAGGIWYSLQPATTPPGSAAPQGQLQNTEFFLSALQFGPARLDNRIAVWSLFNTSALASGNPQAVKLDNTVITTETYGQPGDSTYGGATQKAGPYPLGTSLGQPENEINPNDDRTNQVVYANGLLWSGVNTVIGADGNRTGIAYFIVSPTLQGHNLSASVASQGYVSVAGNNVLFPSIGVNPAGKGVMTFSVSGPDYYPSAGYAKIDATNGAGDVHIAGAGTLPADGFTGYPQFGGGHVERWGDYSAAVADESGNIWMAAEYIAGDRRTSLANWSTFVNEVTP